jgi:hypothetical protein
LSAAARRRRLRAQALQLAAIVGAFTVILASIFLTL